LQIIGDSLRNLGPSHKTLRHPGVPSWLRAWLYAVASKNAATAQLCTNNNINDRNKQEWHRYIRYISSR